MLRVRLLGDIAAEREGEPVPLSGPHRRLLAFLALHPGPHERVALAARFWPDLLTARAKLRTAVWGLRRALGADAVEATRTSVALARIVTDVDEVGPRIARGDLSPLDATPCVGLDDDWVAVVRAEHVRRCVAALDALAITAVDPADAARWTARRCALTPLDEPAHRMLIERLAAAGDRAGALVAGRDLAERLRAELGVGPARATRAAIARLRGSAGGPRNAAVSRPAARLAAAEALACAGDAGAAAAEVRCAVLEPVGPADQPWALVPRMARVQVLVARARGDEAEARRRLTEAADGWRRRRSWVARRAEEYLAALVDLGRPPIVGLVEPDRELARVMGELVDLEVGCRDTR